MAPHKRPAAEDGSLEPGQVVKRQKSNTDLNGNRTIAVVNFDPQKGALIQSVTRTSALQAPVIELSGHGAEVYACRFNRTGEFIASGSQDTDIRLWKVWGQCDNYMKLQGHKGAVLDLAWSRDSDLVHSASADKHIFSWDAETGKRIRRHGGHEGVINALDISRRGTELLFSGSDDGSVGVWDPRTKAPVRYIETDYPITAVASSQTGVEVFSGGIDPDIKVWDMRKNEVPMGLISHADVITSLDLSPEGDKLLSNSMDNTVRAWDIRPFCPTTRLINTFDGAAHGMDMTLIRASWCADGRKVAAGSGDGTVLVWDMASETKLLSKMPGHKGTVNDVRFHPTEPIIVSGSSDRTLLLGELGK